MAYVTPDKFRWMRTGSDLDELADIELAETLSAASTMVDTYCSVPTLPQRHDFRGGSITFEEHKWRIPESSFDIGQRRAYPYHWPIKMTMVNGNPSPAISMLRIYVTNTQYVTIDPGDLFVQQTERYVEIVSLALTSSGLFNALIIPNVGLATPTMRMSYDYGYLLNSDTDETLYASDAQTYRARNQWWTPDAPTVKLNGTVVDPATYDVDVSEGTIYFHSPITPDDAGGPDRVTATYIYTLPNEIGRATALVAASLLGEADLTSKGMAGLQRLTVEEISLQRTRSYGTLVDAGLDATVPAAAALLTGFKQFRMSA